MPNAKQPQEQVAPADVKKKGWFGFRWAFNYWADTKKQAYNARQQQFNRDLLQQYKTLATMHKAPRRVTTFEAAMQRSGLSEKDLAKRLRRLKAVHLGLYFFALAVAVYALFLGLNYSVSSGILALLVTLASGVYGYLNGFRAWQLEHRNLIRLQDAVRIPGTYLVL
jgi:Flp pilus assembly protein TadB